ncbi:MAG: TonB-dependent receptor plug domain-containing protein [Chitinophagaceae bacterium]|nr:TonB-dependent receptor plug domain-containing protein [Chitinophagaceae bacterium]
MKRIAIIHFLLSGSAAVFAQHEAKDSFYLLSPVEVKAIRVGENAPFTKTNLTKKEIGKLNLGQDIPFLLNQTPSVVINSDAGNGVGYTGIRIRGTDATRINVTLNGIPYNDPESQGTFFVDLPDFSSSVGSVQIQRGVGTSSNGAGAFGASINFSTNEVNKDAYAEFNNSIGSFNTWKNTVKAGTGLLGDHFTIDARLSRISSHGYIDRAKTGLRSFYFSTAYLAAKSSLRLNIFSGKEKTYQAWNGVSETDLKNGNRTINYAGMEKPGEPYNNETDNFQQDHYQLFFDHRFTEKLTFNTAVFLIKGKGYYEQYKADRDYADYGIADPAPGVSSTDLIRQLYLENNFYGNIFSLQLKNKLSQFTFGGGWTRFDNNHYGDVIWAQNGLPAPTVRWYDHDAKKTDLNVYIKQQTEFQPNWYLFYDLQYRHIFYDIDGFRDNPLVKVSSDYDFFNPKAGISYNKNGWKGFFSYSIAGKEPNRDDFEAGISQQPKRERLNDIELGIERSLSKTNWSATLYYMPYKDQLVLTGKINDVGAYTRTNIPKSYRLGMELQGGTKVNDWMNIAANFAISRNKVQDFTEYIDDYDLGGQKTNHYNETDIAFSPSAVGSGVINFLPLKNFELGLIGKYVSKQYLDNTQNENRKLDAFYTQDLRLIYTIKGKWLKEMNITGQVNNIFDTKYEPNGYTFSYIYGGDTITENYYFPMAGTNFMIAVNIKL